MNLPYCLIDNKYEINKKIGEGSFGTIFSGLNIIINKVVALKFESINSKTTQLKFEYKLYKNIGENKGIPKIYDYYDSYETPWGKYNILVMEHLNESLEKLFQQCNGFTLKSVLQIAIQMLDRINLLHSKNIIHRDLKPDNFLIDKHNNIYLIDLGLSKFYRDPKTHLHIQYREDKSMIGTPRYASINTHLGIEQSRRDDLESIGYILIYFLNKKLPWQGIKCESRKLKYNKIMKIKLGTSINELCNKLPNEFVLYFEYVRALRFADKPDYSYLISLFKKVAKDLDIFLNYRFDWNNTEKKTDFDQLLDELNESSSDQIK